MPVPGGPPRSLLYAVDEELTGSLKTALLSLGSSVSVADEAVSLDADSVRDSHVIFCSANTAVIHRVRAARPGGRVVVVSHLAETGSWLDALEAGADDYCATPFERLHLQWMLDAGVQRSQRAI